MTLVRTNPFTANKSLIGTFTREAMRDSESLFTTT